MSQSTDTDRGELLELIKADPEEAFRTHPETLWGIRRETDSERVRKLVDYVIEKYDIPKGGDVA